MTTFISHSEEKTALIAKRLADKVHAGDIIALYGTLGAGKTAFSRGFIQTFIPEQDVPSPTFTLLQTYEAPSFLIYHFDMYRLKSPEEAYEIGIEDAFTDGVSLIEWPEKLGKLLPPKHISVRIKVHGRQREITIEGIDL